jgi:hypothetical protein
VFDVGDWKDKSEIEVLTQKHLKSNEVLDKIKDFDILSLKISRKFSFKSEAKNRLEAEKNAWINELKSKTDDQIEFTLEESITDLDFKNYYYVWTCSRNALPWYTNKTALFISDIFLLGGI